MTPALEPSLSLYRDERLIFFSYGKWLYPLFELEEYLFRGPGVSLDPKGLSLRDRMVGKAAALLTLRLGIHRVHAGTISSLGKEALDRAGARVSYDSLVDRILCATEELLQDVDDPEEAHRLLLSRIAVRKSRRTY